MNNLRLAYVSFDVVPAAKGAAIHIEAFVNIIASYYTNIELVTVSPSFEITTSLITPGVTHLALPALGDTLINRTMYFRQQLIKLWEGKMFDLVHIRSIYEGYAIALNKHKYCNKLIFEVNGLPSIELKYRYPKVADDRELLHKLKAQEQICLEKADLIITPSLVTASYLQTRNIPATKIRVIPNGVNLDIFTYNPPNLTETFHLLYFGTLISWQGVNLAIEAIALANKDFPVNLTLIGIGRDRTHQALKQLANKLGVLDKLTILAPMSQAQLVQCIHAANAIIAPLTSNDRNLIQGCCPLKILEGMATGTPVIASDLPIVRELGSDGEQLLLVKPGSAKAIKEAVIRLKEREFATKLARNARSHIEKSYTWQIAGERLIAAYTELGINKSMTV
jgi:glycosyltransferase involved in cell wall biosynthesis